jgi:YVTN family beta-propeller protein
MKMKRLLFLLLASSFLTFSCSDDETTPKGKYDQGVIIANEGNFGNSTASVTFYDPTAQEAQQNIFAKPPLNFAGDVLQSITFKDNRGYLVLNGSNKIEVVNAGTFESINTLENSDMVSPRYIEVINGKAYISVWGPFDANFSLIDSYVLVVDVNSNAVIKKIDTDEGTENLLLVNNKLFVSNYNFGGSNTVDVINPSTNEKINQVEVDAGPASMVVDKNGKLWVLCTGSFSSGTASLVRINPTSLAIEDKIELSASPGNDLAITPDGSSLVYHVRKDVYKISIEATEEPAQPLFTATDIVNPYALGVDPKNGDIWMGDAINFSSDGKAYIYSATGSFKSSFAVGVGPTQFLFK